MFTGGKWHPTYSGKGGRELFYPCEHLRFNRWEGVTYPTTPDYQILEAEESERACFQPTRLFHVTTFTGAQGIFSSGIFRSNIPKNIGVAESFSWWSFEIAEDEKARERRNYQEIINTNALPSDKIHQFFNSPPFQEESRHGNFKFTYDVKSLMAMYESSVCGGGKAELRVLGTFTYKQEVMHAVVVCPSDVAPLFNHCPLVASDDQAAVSKSDQGWTWRPDSTRVVYKPWSRWDHVSLAFHLPRDHPGFQLPPGYPPVTYCEAVVGKLVRQRDIIQEGEFDRCLEELREMWEASGSAEKSPSAEFIKEETVGAGLHGK
ncbi:uncharacterized protein LOC144600917 [Rhinoraja longicauda]